MRRARQSFSKIAIVLILALGIPLAAESPSLAATTLSFAPVRPMAGEYTYIRGKLTTRVNRPVQLQYYTGSRWARLASSKTFWARGTGGHFRFRPRAPIAVSSRLFRVFAPRVVINGSTYRYQYTSPRRMYTIRQAASLRVVPAPIGQAMDPRVTNLRPASARFSPIRRGRRVTLQRYSNGAWRFVTSRVQDGRGLATINIPASVAANYAHRVVAAPFNGAAARISPVARRSTIRPRIFSEEFLGTALNRAKWNYRILGSRDANNRACSESSKQSVRVANGVVSLQTKRIPTTSADYDLTKRTQCPQGQFYNGHLGTMHLDRDRPDLFMFRYGYMAARIKMQPQRGHHGGFWSQPSNPHASGSEIDGVEYYGNSYRLGAIQHSIYRDNSVRAKIVQPRNYLLRSGRKWSSDYHIFSVEWTPSVYIFRVDGHETFRTNQAVSQTQQHLILSLLASDYESGLLPTSGAITPMFVDWVRVWAR